MKKFIKVITLLLAIALVLPSTGLSVAASEIDGIDFVERLGGKDRYETAAIVSKLSYPNGSKNVVIAGHNGEVDALTGTLLAASLDAPLLFTNPNKLSEATLKEIKRLEADNVYILGGENVVSTDIELTLDKLATVSRVKGKDRFETAAEVAKLVSKSKAMTHAFIVLGRSAIDDSLADALAIGPVSARDNSPILLVESDSLPQATKDVLRLLKIKNVTIIGGTVSVNESVEILLEVEGLTVDRISGDDRNHTAVKIAKRYFPNAKTVLMANGRRSADALLGGYFGKLNNAPILFTYDNKEEFLDSTQKYLGYDIIKTYVLGGKSVSTEKTLKEIVMGIKEVMAEKPTEPFVPTIPDIPVVFVSVKFDSNGGSVVSEITKIVKNTTISLPSDPTKAGFEFEGWFTDSKYSNRFVASTLVNTNITLHAKWTNTVDESLFKFDSDTNTITGLTEDGVAYFKENKSLNIPNKIGGKEVREVGPAAFGGSSVNKITSVVIPDTVKTIGARAFSDNELKTVTIPKSVLLIGDSAFNNNGLTSLEIGESVTEIGDQAFALNNLTSLNIPKSVNTIKSKAFYNNNLISVTLNSAAIIIGDEVFLNNGINKKSPNIIIEDNETYPVTWRIVDNAWSNKVDLSSFFEFYSETGTILEYSHLGPKDLVIPGQINGVVVTAIGEDAFSYNKLVSVTIPDSVRSIGKSAFSFNELTSIEIGKSVTSIGEDAFSNNKLVSVTIPNSVTSIGNNAFYNNELTSLIIPNSVTTIGETSFSTNKLTELIIPISVMTIGEGAFNINNLSKVTINSSTLELQWGDFYGKNTLISIGTSFPSGPWMGTWSFNDDKWIKIEE